MYSSALVFQIRNKIQSLISDFRTTAMEIYDFEEQNVSYLKNDFQKFRAVKIPSQRVILYFFKTNESTMITAVDWDFDERNKHCSL